jgi:hypothetical protein
VVVVPALPRPGDRLAGFRIERELGRGTTGVVFLAHQEALDRRVALKVVGRPLADDEAFRARFRREARTVAGLDHPNVVQILGSGEDDDHLWLAMRYVDGPDLRVLLRRTGRLDPVQAVVVVEQVAAALDAAHAAGVVHRDVSPGNVLIEDGPGRDLHVELADFGLARAPGPEDPGGTPGYAAPEQLAGADATPAADVYGLGCVLYLLLTGVAPPAPAVPAAGATHPAGATFTAGAGSAAGAAAGAGVLRPSEALPRLGGAFDPAVERATDPDPARRFASAGELAIWARAALTVPRPAAGAVADGPPAADVRAAAALPATPAEVGPTAVTWEAPPRRRRRTRWLLLPLAVLLLAALATAFVFLGRLGTGADDTDRRAGAPPAGTTTGAAGSTPLRTGTTGGSASSARAGSSGAGARSTGGGGTRGAGSAGSAGSGGTSGAGVTGRGSSGAPASGGAARSGAGPGGAASAGRDPSVDSAGEPGVGSSATATAGGSGTTAAPGRATGVGRATPPSVGGGAPGAGAAVALPPVARGAVRFGGGYWSLDLPASEGWRQTSSTEQDGGARIVTRLERPDRVRLLVEQLPGRTAVFGPAPGAGFAVRLPDAGRVTATLFRGGRYALCADACAAVPANGPSGGVLLIAGAHRADGARRLARRAASGLRVR